MPSAMSKRRVTRRSGVRRAHSRRPRLRGARPCTQPGATCCPTSDTRPATPCRHHATSPSTSAASFAGEVPRRGRTSRTHGTAERHRERWRTGPLTIQAHRRGARASWCRTAFEPGDALHGLEPWLASRRIVGEENHGTERGRSWIGAEAVRAHGKRGPDDPARHLSSPAPSHCRATAGAPGLGAPRRIAGSGSVEITVTASASTLCPRCPSAAARDDLPAAATPQRATAHPPIETAAARNATHPAIALRRPRQGRPESSQGRRRLRRSHARPGPGLPSHEEACDPRHAEQDRVRRRLDDRPTYDRGDEPVGHRARRTAGTPVTSWRSENARL